LSPEAIEFAKRHSSDATFLCGDFETLAIPGAFDYVVTADTMGHVEDHERFLGRITDLLVPGGLLVLMTQNPFVWNRTSSLAQPARGQIRNWPGLKRLRALLTSRYEILRISSIVPGGDRGFLRMVNSPYVAGLLRHIIGRDRATALYERLLLGRELVLVARRR
jgi:2-polyprenyl-3-methyl-5-hydroxy-6-metoxy-1,4-benzoquinol methylase